MSTSAQPRTTNAPSTGRPSAGTGNATSGPGPQHAHVESAASAHGAGWGLVIEHAPGDTVERSAGAAHSDTEAMALHGVLDALEHTDPARALEISTSIATLHQRIIHGALARSAPRTEPHAALWNALRKAGARRTIEWRRPSTRNPSTAGERALELAQAQARRHTAPTGARRIETPISAAMLRRQLERAGPHARAETDATPAPVHGATLAAWLDTIPGATMIRTDGPIRITESAPQGHIEPTRQDDEE